MLDVKAREYLRTGLTADISLPRVRLYGFITEKPIAAAYPRRLEPRCNRLDNVSVRPLPFR